MRKLIQLCAKGELRSEQAFLLLGRVYPVLIGFLHRGSFFAGGKKRKRSHIPCLEQGTRLSSPWLKRGVFRRGKDKRCPCIFFTTFQYIYQHALFLHPSK